jgi:hypothetical protein
MRAAADAMPKDGLMNVRRVVLDVDMAFNRPTLPELAAAITQVAGVEATAMVITEIDLETIGLDVTVEGSGISIDALVEAIEATGAVSHAIDELAAGSRLIEARRRSR